METKKLLPPTPFQANFSDLCSRYSKLILFVRENRVLVEDTASLREAVKEYLESAEWNPEVLAAETTPISWVWSVHKLHPVKYYGFEEKRKAGPCNDDDLFDYLVKACIRQSEFTHKIVLPELTVPNQKKYVKLYKKFLYMCRMWPRKVMVPTLAQDFVWHSHMQDNAAYRADAISKVGRFLDHNDDIEPTLLSKFATETQVIRKKVMVSMKDKVEGSSAFCGSACGGANNAGCGGCGAGCGGGQHAFCGAACGGANNAGCGGCGAGCGGGQHAFCGAACGGANNAGCGGCGAGCGGGQHAFCGAACGGANNAGCGGCGAGCGGGQHAFCGAACGGANNAGCGGCGAACGGQHAFCGSACGGANNASCGGDMKAASCGGDMKASCGAACGATTSTTPVTTTPVESH